MSLVSPLSRVDDLKVLLMSRAEVSRQHGWRQWKLCPVVVSMVFGCFPHEIMAIAI